MLELLLELRKLRKDVPLSLDQQVKLVKALLNDRVQRFDFDVLIIPTPHLRENGIFLKFEEIFDAIWTKLAEKCPNLLEISEMRPDRYHGYSDIELNHKVLNFSKLTCLETNCFITEGENQTCQKS